MIRFHKLLLYCLIPLLIFPLIAAAAIRLVWDTYPIPKTQIAGYSLEVSLDNGISWTSFFLKPDSFEYTYDFIIAKGVTYCFRLSALATGKQSPLSNTVCNKGK